MTHALLFSVFVIASCGLVYELIAGTLASYLLGDSITQFSTIIGTYLFSMGIGSFLSRYIGKGLVARFVFIELCVGVIGGSSAALLFLVFSFVGAFRLILYFLVVVIGILVGLEIPLLLRILKERLQFKDLVAQVLTFDYLGALLASLAFPLFLAPRIGLVRTCFLFGLMNVLVAGWTAWLFRGMLTSARWIRSQCLAAGMLLLIGLVYANEITTFAEEALYEDEIVYARSSSYQRIVLTKWKDDLRLYLNGHLQFSSRDEYRYHEALVHPGLQSIPGARKALVLGGGDGLAAREILRYPGIESITLVDLDPEMTRLFSQHPALRELNSGALESRKLHIVNADAFVWLEQTKESFDFAAVDFPDPTNHSLGKLYTTAFYRLLARCIGENGLIAIQATSPMFARQSFWCIVSTLEESKLHASPYHAYVPSFGEWGFVIASRRPYVAPSSFRSDLRFVSPEVVRSMFEFPKDMDRIPAEVNRLNNQILVQYYESEWSKVTQ